MNRQRFKTNRKGFTLVELMIVVAIIALLATISTPNLFGFLKRTKARDGANAIASYLQNARDQAMSRGEVVLLRVVTTNLGDVEISTYRAPLVEPNIQEQTPTGIVTRDRFASTCSEITDPLLPEPYTINNRVAVLNPQGSVNNVELAEPLDPNVRVVALTSPPDGQVRPAGTTSNIDLCFSPDGRVYTRDGAEITSQDGGCTSSMVFVVTSDPDIGAAPAGPSENLGDASLTNWVCPPAGGSADQRRTRYITLDVAREANFVYAVSMTFNGRVKVD